MEIGQLKEEWVTVQTLQLTKEFRFEGRRVAWDSMSQGAPMVLIHGTPFSSHVWRRIAPHLTTRRKVYLFDLLGYGRSDMSPGNDVSLGVQGKLLSALLDYWNVVYPDILAHDFGGATALRAALLDNQRFCTLTLVDPVALAPLGISLRTTRLRP